MVNIGSLVIWTGVASIVFGGIIASGAFTWSKRRTLAKRLVYCKCPWCRRPISAGDPVVLHGPWRPGEPAPAGTTWYSDGEGFRFAVGCADPKCAAITGASQRGECMMKNGMFFIVER